METEVCIAELPTIDAVMIVMYRPSGKNFSLGKYTEAITRINKHLRDNEENYNGKHIMLMGDFNFPKNIVEWKESGNGLVADFKQGQEAQKQAFDQLLALTEEHQLEQLVNQPTRGKNVLDLIFTNQRHLFGECSTNIIKPQSDHNMVNFDMANPTYIKHTNIEDNEIPTPEIATFNFPKGNDESVKKALERRKWKEVLEVNEENKVDSLAERLTAEFVSIAKEAKVPKFAGNCNLEQGSKYHQKLLKQRKELIKHQIEASTLYQRRLCEVC